MRAAAIAAGVRCIEHGVYMDEATASNMRKADVSFVPTISILHAFREDASTMGLPAEVLPRVQGVEQAQCEAVLIARAAGLRVGSGSDLLGPDQRRFGLEIALKAELVGILEAIRSATLVNAEILGLAHEIGTVERIGREDVVAERDGRRQRQRHDGRSSATHGFRRTPTPSSSTSTTSPSRR